MRPKDAVEAARNIWAGPRVGEAERLNRIADALKPPHLCRISVEMPEKALPVMRNMARKARTNVLPLVLDTFSQVMKVDGYMSANQAENSQPWTYWQRNGMDARQAGITRSALAFGASYVVVSKGDPVPLMRGASPRRMTALYQDQSADEWPMLALEVDGPMLRLYDEEAVYFIGARKDYPKSGLGASALVVEYDPAGFEFIEARPHGLGVCPVVRFRDLMLLEGEQQFGIIEPLLSIQDRIDETTFGMLIAQYYSAFKQRYILGWVPTSEQEKLKASASQIWTFSGENVKVGELSETDLTRYLQSKDSAFRDLSAIGQVPAQNLGIDGISNISSDTLAALESGKERKASEMKTSLGESWEQALRLAAHAAGDEAGASDFSSQVRWKDTTVQTPGQLVDALGKMVQMLGIPAEMTWPMIPGWTDQDVERARVLAKSADAMSGLMETLNRQAAPAQPVNPLLS